MPVGLPGVDVHDLYSGAAAPVVDVDRSGPARRRPELDRLGLDQPSQLHSLDLILWPIAELHTLRLRRVTPVVISPRNGPTLRPVSDPVATAGDF